MPSLLSCVLFSQWEATTQCSFSAMWGCWFCIQWPSAVQPHQLATRFGSISTWVACSALQLLERTCCATGTFTTKRKRWLTCKLPYVLSPLCSSLSSPTVSESLFVSLVLGMRNRPQHWKEWGKCSSGKFGFYTSLLQHWYSILFFFFFARNVAQIVDYLHF